MVPLKVYFLLYHVFNFGLFVYKKEAKCGYVFTCHCSFVFLVARPGGGTQTPPLGLLDLDLAVAVLLLKLLEPYNTEERFLGSEVDLDVN